jgi:hypothetical protein
VVEEGQDVGAAAPQGAAELGDLLQSCGHGSAERFDQPGHCVFAAAAIRVGVGGDDLLIDQPGDFHGEVFVDIEHAGQPGVLAGGEQLDAGAGDAADVGLWRPPGSPYSMFIAPLCRGRMRVRGRRTGFERASDDSVDELSSSPRSAAIPH